MEALLAWIGDRIAVLVIWQTIYDWQRGIKIRLGRIRGELGPGLHWRWPFIEEFEVADTTERTTDLRPAAATTLDGKPVTASANMIYKVVSPAKMWKTVQSVDDSVKNMALGYLVEAIGSRRWESVVRDRRHIQEWMLAEVNKEFSRWGVRVIKVTITDLVITKQIRLFMDGVESFNADS